MADQIPDDSDLLDAASLDELLKAAAVESSDSPTAGEAGEADIDAILAANAPAAGQPAEADALSADWAAAFAEAPSTDAPPSGSPPQKFDFPDLSPPSFEGIDLNKMSMLSDVKLNVRIELGRTRMLVEDVLKLGEGSVVELDKLAGDPVDVIVNGRLVARGEVLILNDNFCVRICEVLENDPHRVAV